METLRNYFNWCLLLVPNIMRFFFHLSIQDWIAIMGFMVMLVVNSRAIVTSVRYWIRVKRFKRRKNEG
jgi:hypothetical protein